MLSQSVPPGKVSELIKLTENLSNSQREVEIAEAGVAAIAAMLAANQAALLQKQYHVGTSMELVRQFIYELETKSGLTHKVLPKIRVAPAVSLPKRRSNSI